MKKLYSIVIILLVIVLVMIGITSKVPNSLQIGSVVKYALRSSAFRNEDFRQRDYLENLLLGRVEDNDPDYEEALRLLSEIIVFLHLNISLIDLKNEKYIRMLILKHFNSMGGFLSAPYDLQVECAINLFVPQTSSIMRNLVQLKSLELLIPQIASEKKKNGERNITLEVFGSQHGQEIVSILTILQRLASRPDFQPLFEETTFTIVGVEISRDNIEAAIQKLSGVANGSEIYTADEVNDKEFILSINGHAVLTSHERQLLSDEANMALKQMYLKKNIRIVFRNNSLLDEQVFGDIILCNNVAYMLDQDSIERFRKRLIDNGKNVCIFCNDFLQIGLDKAPFISIMPEVFTLNTSSFNLNFRDAMIKDSYLENKTRDTFESAA